ncbi:three-Cys-motif partner protein TcmP [Actinopolymorpha alba]|uniref:three-Cys-motif partner protein TcmP n=1 Tax=Actinopolymorpha alba TaxID=533267 RepID=UPI00039D5134|nr:three-Cys-motif partner protein TcmP [Actinopolymorpha alba]
MASDADPSKWNCPAHTKAKHEMLRRYLDGWYPILSKWNGRILFLDGFAGRGRYNDGSEGSPLIALRRLVEHRFFPQMAHREFLFYFVEANRDNAAALQHEINQLKVELAPWPATVKAHVLNEKFDVTANAIISRLREQKQTLAPTFAFVDPFGYSGMPLELLAGLLDYPRSEVFVNFMVGHVMRFIERDGQEAAMRGLFGMDVRDVLDGWDGRRDRVEHLRSVYGRQLQTRAGFDHVQSFAMINATGNVGYYLFHGTRHRVGVQRMKAAMWAVDPGGGFTFSDRLAGEDVLFALEPDLSPLRQELLRYYAGQKRIAVEDIEWYTLLHTPYRETHVRPVLRQLESDGCIVVNRPPGKRQFADGVTISFP